MAYPIAAVRSRVFGSSAAPGGAKGFFAGGNGSGGNKATADKLVYSTDTTAACTTANLSQARSGPGSASNGSTKGYFAGGDTGGWVATADKITYSTDTAAACTTANLSQARGYLAGAGGGVTKGYFAGGWTGSNVPVVTTDKVTYSTDTTAACATANLSQARFALTGISENSTKSYFAGGRSGGPHYATADKLVYSTDTTAACTTADLSQARRLSGGVSDGSTKGYFAGGNTGLYDWVVTADKLVYSTDTTAACTTANLSGIRGGLAGISEGPMRGYFAGGNSSAFSWVVIADKLVYSTDTTATCATADLSQAREFLAGISDIGW